MLNQKKSNFVPINHQIRSYKILCIDHMNNNLGEILTSEAIKIASEQGLDLVQVSQNKDEMPTCKILDYGKYKYQQSKNQRAAAKKQRENLVKTKEIKFRPNTDVNDLKVKANKAQKFLDEGHNIKISVLFKGREISYQDIGNQVLEEFIQLLSSVQLVGKPVMNGRTLSVIGIKKSN